MTGIDAKHCTNHLEQDALVQEHIRKLRERAEFQMVPIVFVPENQTGFFETRMEEYISSLPNAVTFCQHGNEARPGVRKDAAVTKQYVKHTFDYLAQHSILLDAEWISAEGDSYGTNGRESLLEELKTQLIRYGYDEKGKLTGKYEHGLNDDLCIAFMMLMHWMTVAENATNASPYAKYRFPGPFDGK